MPKRVQDKAAGAIAGRFLTGTVKLRDAARLYRTASLSSAESGQCRLKGANRNRAAYDDGLAKLFDALDFVEGLGRKIGLSAVGAGVHRNGFDDQ